jgi:hypothetical protein
LAVNPETFGRIDKVVQIDPAKAAFPCRLLPFGDQPVLLLIGLRLRLLKRDAENVQYLRIAAVRASTLEKIELAVLTGTHRPHPTASNWTGRFLAGHAAMAELP